MSGANNKRMSKTIRGNMVKEKGEMEGCKYFLWKTKTNFLIRSAED